MELSHGANINARDKSGALMLAAEKCHGYVLSHFLSHKADVNTVDTFHEVSALHLAVIKGTQTRFRCCYHMVQMHVQRLSAPDSLWVDAINH